VGKEVIPGILHLKKSPSQIDAQKCIDTFRINTIGPLLLINRFSPFFPKKKSHLSYTPAGDSESEVQMIVFGWEEGFDLGGGGRGSGFVWYGGRGYLLLLGVEGWKIG
jgi:hypothetical protein